jgi:predicted protein tyrosine phosphatase
MPKIYIRNRAEIEERAERPFHKNTAIISITDVGYEFAKLQNKPSDLLQLKFDDVDADEPFNIITNKQAVEIAKFYHKVSKTAKRILCQCEHGQGRSAAIAAAILEYQTGNGIDIFANDRYFPNKVVFRKVYQALKAIER